MLDYYLLEKIVLIGLKNLTLFKEKRQLDPGLGFNFYKKKIAQSRSKSGFNKN
jgi:hypothetical protein